VIRLVLFCIYIDKLLLQLSKSGLVCFSGQVFLGALAYADDIVLLAPTHRAMRNMLAVCDSFAREYIVVLWQKVKVFVLQLISYSFSYFYHYATVVSRW